MHPHNHRLEGSGSQRHLVDLHSFRKHALLGYFNPIQAESKKLPHGAPFIHVTYPAA